MSIASKPSYSCYFASRSELLGWVNRELDLSLSKIEEVATGAVYCQLMDRLYPGKVPMKKVNFNARSTTDYVANFKVLQSVFDKLGIEQAIPVDRLVKGKPLDNTEFLQWMKMYYDTHSGDADASCGDYQPQARREGAMGVQRKPSTSRPPARTTTTTAAAAPTGSAAASLKGSSTMNRARPAAGSAASAGPSSATKTINDLRKQLAEATILTKGTMSERDFYFGKLQEVERVCQELSQSKDNHPDTELVLAQIKQVLYKGFDSPVGASAGALSSAQKGGGGGGGGGGIGIGSGSLTRSRSRSRSSTSPPLGVVISGSPLAAYNDKAATMTPSPGGTVSARIFR